MGTQMKRQYGQCTYGINENYLAPTAATVVGTAVDDSAIFDIAAIAEGRLIVTKCIDDVGWHIGPVMFTAGNLTVTKNSMPFAATAVIISRTIIATHINTSNINLFHLRHPSCFTLH